MCVKGKAERLFPGRGFKIIEGLPSVPMDRVGSDGCLHTYISTSHPYLRPGWKFQKVPPSADLSSALCRESFISFLL